MQPQVDHPSEIRCPICGQASELVFLPTVAYPPAWVCSGILVLVPSARCPKHGLRWITTLADLRNTLGRVVYGGQPPPGDILVGEVQALT